MTSWRDVPSDVLAQEWAVALATDVGGHMPHADLGRRLVELAAEIDRRVLAGESGLLSPSPARAPVRRAATSTLMDSAWLTTYLTRGALADGAQPVLRTTQPAQASPAAAVASASASVPAPDHA